MMNRLARQVETPDIPTTSAKPVNQVLNGFYYFTKRVKISSLNKYDLIIANTNNQSGKFYEFLSYDDEDSNFTYLDFKGTIKQAKLPNHGFINKIVIPESRNEIFDALGCLYKGVLVKQFRTLKLNLREATIKKLEDITQKLSTELTPNELIAITPSKKFPSPRPIINFVDDENTIPKLDTIPETPEESIGQGYLGGSLSDNISKFREICNPSFSIVGKTINVYLYKLAF